MSDAQLSRGVAAALLAGTLIAVTARSPRVGVLATLLFLPFLALLRRVLILAGGWASLDPLLFVAPAVAGILLIRLFLVERRRIAPEPVSIALVCLIALAVIHSVHPFGFGLRANLAGFMFLGLPLVWFFIGRELAGVDAVRALLPATLAMATAAALYSLVQIEVGFPVWDERWIEENGYSSLFITEEVIRPFGTFASSAEFGTFLSIGIVIALAFGVHLRRAFFVPIPLLIYVLFLNSSRGIFVISLAVGVGVLALHARGRWAQTAATIGAFAAVAGATVGLAYVLHPGALSAHQLQGISSPLERNRSTLLLHLEIIGEGFEEAVSHPLGQGTAATTIAATTVADAEESKTSEFDLLDLFIALGFLGLLVGLAVVVLALRRSLGLFLARPGPVTLACLGLVVASFGNWFNGGFYAIAPLTWVVLGFTCRCWMEIEPASRNS